MRLARVRVRCIRMGLAQVGVQCVRMWLAQVEFPSVLECGWLSGKVVVYTYLLEIQTA